MTQEIKSDKYFDELLDSAVKFQNEMHTFINQFAATKRGSGIAYKDIQTTFYALKFSELFKRIELLESNMYDILKNNNQ